MIRSTQCSLLDDSILALDVGTSGFINSIELTVTGTGVGFDPAVRLNRQDLTDQYARKTALSIRSEPGTVITIHACVSQEKCQVPSCGRVTLPAAASRRALSFRLVQPLSVKTTSND